MPGVYRTRAAPGPGAVSLWRGPTPLVLRFAGRRWDVPRPAAARGTAAETRGVGAPLPERTDTALDDTRCPEGNRIQLRDRRQGTGGCPQCAICAAERP